jgi:hypothetical protein
MCYAFLAMRIAIRQIDRDRADTEFVASLVRVGNGGILAVRAAS